METIFKCSEYIWKTQSVEILSQIRYWILFVCFLLNIWRKRISNFLHSWYWKCYKNSFYSLISGISGRNIFTFRINKLILNFIDVFGDLHDWNTHFWQSKFMLCLSLFSTEMTQKNRKRRRIRKEERKKGKKEKLLWNSLKWTNDHFRLFLAIFHSQILMI